jgi:hypothetical protein
VGRLNLLQDVVLGPYKKDRTDDDIISRIIRE